MRSFEEIFREYDQVDKFFPLFERVLILADKKVDESILNFSQNGKEVSIIDFGVLNLIGREPFLGDDLDEDLSFVEVDFADMHRVVAEYARDLDVVNCVAEGLEFFVDPRVGWGWLRDEVFLWLL